VLACRRGDPPDAGVVGAPVTGRDEICVTPLTRTGVWGRWVRAQQIGPDPITGIWDSAERRMGQALAMLGAAHLAADQDPDRALAVIHIDHDILSGEAEGNATTETTPTRAVPVLTGAPGAMAAASPPLGAWRPVRSDGTARVGRSVEAWRPCNPAGEGSTTSR
jgi:hypothetical protein